MYAVVGTSKIDPAQADKATEMLNNGILPGISQAPGFVSATFTRSADGTTGRSMVVFSSEAEAKAVAATGGDRIPEGAPIELVSLEVCEVVAQA